MRSNAVMPRVGDGTRTLVDAMFRQSSLFRTSQSAQDGVIDRLDLEGERGAAIAAKNCAIARCDGKINIMDTPGQNGEMVEITPSSPRMRKRILRAANRRQNSGKELV